MTNYVLVHGGDRDGSVWNDVAKILTQHGHHVFCPSMTSVKKSTLQDNINEVVEYILANKIENFVLVGHSYGGFVITGVADKLSNRVSSLIYVDALIPKNGKSLHDLTIEYHFDYMAHGLTKDPAVMSKIVFDPVKVFKRPKIYIHCLQSEFIDLTKPIYEDLKNPMMIGCFFV